MKVLYLTFFCIILSTVLFNNNVVHSIERSRESVLLEGMKDLTSQHGGIIQWNMDLAKKYLKERPYEILALFTSSDSRHGCSVCDAAAAEYASYTESYMAYFNSPEFNKRPIFLILAEVGNCMELFSQIGLQTIPHLFYYPAGNSTQPSKERIEVEKQKLSEFIQRKTGVNIPVIIPFSEKMTYWSYVVGGIVISIRVLVFVWGKRKNPYLYYTAAIILFSLVIGGIFFDFIHKPPLMEYNYHSKSYHYFSRGPRNQTIAEGLIMGSLTVLTSFVFLFIARLAENPSEYSTGTLKSFSFLAILVFCVLLSLLSRGYSIKYYRSWLSGPMLASSQ